MLLFSRNDTRKAWSLIGDMYDHVDEIVLVDSSNGREHGALVSKAASLKKLRIHYVVPLGYLEPALMYAIGKCSGSWILLMNTDERLSADLKRDIRMLTESAGCSAFSIRRYENVADGSRGPYANWQTRLFRKGTVEFRGIIHEQPEVRGSLERLGDGYYMDHVDRLKGASSLGYYVMERFNRISYRNFNERLVDYLY